LVVEIKLLLSSSSFAITTFTDVAESVIIKKILLDNNNIFCFFRF
jgi:hypothetical protein